MRLIALLAASLVLSGCDTLFDLKPIATGAQQPQPYDRCAPGGYDDPLRYNFVPTQAIGSSTWADARLDCQRRGMDLAVFNDVHEMGKVDVAEWPYWFGISQPDGSSWATVDGCPAVGMPTPIAHASGSMCGAMFGTLDPNGNDCSGMLPPPMDTGPDHVLGALCETPRPLTADCLPKDPTLETYTASPTPMAYEAARKFCADMGDHLVVIDSHDELQLLSRLITGGNVSSEFWIGATFDGTWKSVTGCPAEFSWTDFGPNFVGDVFPNCVASVLMPDVESPSLVLGGMALAKCDDATKIALCESD